MNKAQAFDPCRTCSACFFWLGSRLLARMSPRLDQGLDVLDSIPACDCGRISCAQTHCPKREHNGRTLAVEVERNALDYSLPRKNQPSRGTVVLERLLVPSVFLSSPLLSLSLLAPVREEKGRLEIPDSIDLTRLLLSPCELEDSLCVVACHPRFRGGCLLPHRTMATASSLLRPHHRHSFPV